MNNKLRALTATTLSMSLLLTACSGSNKNANSEDDGDTLRLIETSDIPTLDSTKATDAVSFNTFNQVMEGLYVLNKDDKAIPGVAEGDPEKSEDGKTWTIKLRKDAKWSNDDPVTAHDFVFAWRKAVDPANASEYAYILYDLKNAKAINEGKMKPEELAVKAIDDYTLQFELNKNLPYYQELLTFGTFLPQNEKFVKEQGEKYGTTKDTTLYNGPFTMSDWKTENQFTLSKNEKYWDKDQVKLKKINSKIVKEKQTALNLFDTGKVDRVVLSAENVDKYKDDKRLTTELDASTFFVRMNQKNSDLANKELRMALAKSIDKEKYVKNNLNNGSVAVDTLMPTQFVKGPDGKDYIDGVKSPLNYDKDEAKKHYEKAQQELGKKEFTFEFLTFDQDSAKKDAEYFKEQIETSLPGVKLKIKQQPFKQKLDLESKMDYDLSLAGWGPDYPDPITFLDLFITNGSHNQTNWSSKEYDQMIDDASNKYLDDVEKRWTTLQDAETLFLNDAVIIPLYQRGAARLTEPYVKNVERHKFAADYTYKGTYIDKK